MATSQFTIYTSADPYGPGPLTGTTGSLISVLDACLVNGYGTGQYTKVAAGWTKPLANVSSSLGCWQQPSGSKMTLFVNDSGPNVTSLAKEAWITGWEYMTNLAPSGSVFTASNSAGNGYGQFPLPSQLLTYGHVVWRKSASNDSVARSWIIAADAYTMYIWISAGDTIAPPYYYHGGFGDIFSLKNQTDIWRCFIYGRVLENTAAGVTTADWTDLIALGSQRDQSNNLTSAQPGHFIARTPGGTGGSQTFTKSGNGSLTPQSITANAPYGCALYGILSGPNSI